MDLKTTAQAYNITRFRRYYAVATDLLKGAPWDTIAVATMHEELKYEV